MTLFSICERAGAEDELFECVEPYLARVLASVFIHMLHNNKASSVDLQLLSDCGYSHQFRFQPCQMTTMFSSALHSAGLSERMDGLYYLPQALGQPQATFSVSSVVKVPALAAWLRSPG